MSLKYFDILTTKEHGHQRNRHHYLYDVYFVSISISIDGYDFTELTMPKKQSGASSCKTLLLPYLIYVNENGQRNHKYETVELCCME